MTQAEGEEIARSLIELVPDTAREILDLTCGDGELGAALKDRAKAAGHRCTVTGVDTRPEQVVVARERLDSAAIANPIRVALPYPPRSFDVVIAAGTFDEVDDPPRLAKLVFQWMKPKGRLVAVGADLPSLAGILLAAGFRSVSADDTSAAGVVTAERPAEPLLHRPVRSVSFVTVVTNQVETAGFLKAIADAKQEAAFEIIVVDDASGDRTSTMEGTDDGSVIILHNEVPAGLVAGMARGARFAHSKELAFFRPSLAVGSGFARAVDNILSSDRSIGGLVPLVLAPDGKVESAGHIVSEGGAGPILSNPHQGVGILAEATTTVRPVRYLSPDACIVRRTAYEMVGGFDISLAAEAAGLDLAAKLAAEDWQVFFEPSLRVVTRL